MIKQRLNYAELAPAPYKNMVSALMALEKGTLDKATIELMFMRVSPSSLRGGISHPQKFFPSPFPAPARPAPPTRQNTIYGVVDKTNINI
jgi:hypothetical protein